MRLLCLAAIALLQLAGATAQTDSTIPSNPPIHCLIVGGGPDKEDNQVAIESNVRYVRSLLPEGSLVHVLYANGDVHSRVVQYVDKEGLKHYRASVLGHVDGAAGTSSFRKNLGEVTDGAPHPLMLYFTGHGSPGRRYDESANEYDLWGDDAITVSDLSQSLGNVDDSTPVTLIMVQCFSGAFAQTLFKPDADGHPVVRPKSCGFFASVSQREAAGCTPEINEADYRDFTTYFFGALSGHDRIGRPVTSADYDHDGVVEMDEAYAYTLVNDRSIDTPVSTSDAYVRRFADLPNGEVFGTSYATLLSYASPAQAAALEGLSRQLKLTTDDRLRIAFSAFRRRAVYDEDSESEDEGEQTARWIRFVRLAKTVILEHKIETSGPDDVRAGLSEILAAEHSNPLKPGQDRTPPPDKTPAPPTPQATP